VGRGDDLVLTDGGEGRWREGRGREFSGIQWESIENGTRR